MQTDYRKMVDALKVVVVRREQILDFFNILSIKIQLGNIKQHIGNCFVFLIRSFMEFCGLYTLGMTSGQCSRLDECRNMDTDHEIVDYGYYVC